MRYSRRRLIAAASAGLAAAACARGKPKPSTSTSLSGTPRAGAQAASPAATPAASPAASATRFVAPADPAWTYYAGLWRTVASPGFPAPRMEPVMGNGGAEGIGRRFAIATDSPTAVLFIRGIGQTLRVSINGEVQTLGPYPSDGSPVQARLYSGRRGVTLIDVWTAFQGGNDGLYIEDGHQVMAPASNPAGRKKLLGIGHSYMEGTGASAPGWTSALPLVADALRWQPINQGIGSTDVNADGVKGPGSSGLSRLQRDVIDLAPDAVLIEYGLNASGVAPAIYQDDAIRFLRQLRAGLPSVPVFWSGVSAVRPLSDLQLLPLNAAIRAACAAVAGCLYIGVSGLDVASGIGPDGTHPNDTGYHFLANRYLAAMLPALGHR